MSVELNCSNARGAGKEEPPFGSGKKLNVLIKAFSTASVVLRDHLGDRRERKGGDQ